MHTSVQKSIKYAQIIFFLKIIEFKWFFLLEIFRSLKTPKWCVFRRRKTPKNVSFRPLKTPIRSCIFSGALKLKMPKRCILGAGKDQKVIEILKGQWYYFVVYLNILQVPIVKKRIFVLYSPQVEQP